MFFRDRSCNSLHSIISSHNLSPSFGPTYDHLKKEWSEKRWSLISVYSFSFTTLYSSLSYQVSVKMFNGSWVSLSPPLTHFLSFSQKELRWRHREPCTLLLRPGPTPSRLDYDIPSPTYLLWLVTLLAFSHLVVTLSVRFASSFTVFGTSSTHVRELFTIYIYLSLGPVNGKTLTWRSFKWSLETIYFKDRCETLNHLNLSVGPLDLEILQRIHDGT